MVEEINLVRELYVYFLEIRTKTSYNLEDPRILLPESFESQRADLTIQVFDLDIL